MPHVDMASFLPSCGTIPASLPLSDFMYMVMACIRADLRKDPGGVIRYERSV